MTAEEALKETLKDAGGEVGEEAVEKKEEVAEEKKEEEAAEFKQLLRGSHGRTLISDITPPQPTFQPARSQGPS